MLRDLLARLAPPRRDRPVAFELPNLHTADDAVEALAALASGVADGVLTPSEAQDLARVVGTWAQAHEIRDLEARLRSMELALGGKTHAT